MINGDPPKPGPNAGRKACKVGSARARRCFRWARLACCTAGAQTRPSAGGHLGNVGLNLTLTRQATHDPHSRSCAAERRFLVRTEAITRIDQD